MVTAPKHYCCRPAVGYVKPNETVELQVMVEPLEDEKKLEAEKHKFMVQALVVRHAPGDKKVESMEESVDDHSKSHELKELPDPHDFWQLEHPKKDIMYHKFPVAFFQPNQMTKEQLETTVRELTSRAAAEAADEMEREREREDEERREREILLKKGKNLTPEERARLEMLQALAQIALAKKNIHGILRVTPPEELVFHGPYTEYT
uniref:Major sperm protein n=1 Tax=Panagrolaimus sp. JU765 TaxID=591449 RepID=A0AC34RCB4_9BILA